MSNPQWQLDRDQMTQVLESMSNEDLRILYGRIADQLNSRRSAEKAAMLTRFDVGDRVEYTAASGKLVRGMVWKINRKTASVVCEDGNKWNVSPEFLRKGGGK